MQRIAICCIVFLATSRLVAAELPNVPLIEGESIKITMKEFIGIPHTFGKEVTRISTKDGDRIQLKTPQMVIQAKEIMVRCPHDTGANFWIVEIAKEPKLLNVQCAPGPADGWLPWPRTIHGVK